MAFALTADQEHKLRDILARYPNKMAACIPVLHLCQEANQNWVSEDVIQYVSNLLDLSPAHVKGVVTFYTLFNQEPPGKHQVWICQTLSCALRGSEQLLKHCEKKLGCHVGETTKDGKVTLRTAECLAACGTAPVMQVNKRYYENLTTTEVDKILDRLLQEGWKMLKLANYLSHSYGKPEGYTLAAYEQAGGYRGVQKALGMSRDAVIDEVKRAHIRGRGGAGFDCGMKWSFMPKESKKPHYLVINADEGEPGTFKDRSIMELNPHSLIEGCIIGCYAIGAHACYIYVRDELHLSKERLWAAIAEAKSRGYLGDRPFGKDYKVEIYVHTGAGAYICGEETALLNSLEGRRGEPRLKPPFPAQYGAFGCPSTVNNVETIAIVPTVFELGGDNFSQLSALHGFNDGGARLFGVSGHVNKPGLYEACVGLTLRELIYDLGGGIQGGRQLIGVIPGGSSCPVHLPDEIINNPNDPRFEPYNGKSILDLPLGVDTFRNVGSMLGTCCAIVLSDAADPVLSLHNLMRFYRHESCGQCTPCREGCGWIERILDKIIEGDGSIEELNQVSEIASDITGNTICAFGDGAAQPALAFVRKYRKHFEDYILNGAKSQTRSLVL